MQRRRDLWALEEIERIWAELKIIFNTSTEASVAVNLVVGWGPSAKERVAAEVLLGTRF